MYLIHYGNASCALPLEVLRVFLITLMFMAFIFFRIDEMTCSQSNNLCFVIRVCGARHTLVGEG